MNIGSISHAYHPQQTLRPGASSAANQPMPQSLDNDGDHDHGAPDTDKGQNIDIRA